MSVTVAPLSESVQPTPYQPSVFEKAASGINTVVSPVSALVKSIDGLQEVVECVALGVFAGFGEGTLPVMRSNFGKLSAGIDATRIFGRVKYFVGSEPKASDKEARSMSKDYNDQRWGSLVGTILLVFADVAAIFAVLTEVKITNDLLVNFGGYAKKIGISTVFGQPLSFGLVGALVGTAGLGFLIVDTIQQLCVNKDENKFWTILLDLASKITKFVAKMFFFFSGMAATNIAFIGFIGAGLAIASSLHSKLAKPALATA